MSEQWKPWWAGLTLAAYAARGRARLPGPNLVGDALVLDAVYDGLYANEKVSKLLDKIRGFHERER